MKYKHRKVFLVYLCIMVAVLGGCKKSADEEYVETTLSTEEIVAIHAGETDVYLDEAQYYAFTAQATYETYFLTEGKQLDWESEMEKGISWQQGVKSTVLDDICKRECLYALAEEYNISLSEEEIKEIDIMVKNYFENTNGKLRCKIDIQKERLKFVFEKKAIADKVEDIMNASDKKLAKETYKKWKDVNTVTAEEQWKNITFSKPIFTLEDIQ